MTQIQTFLHWHLLLLSITYVAIDSNDIEVQIESADPDRSGSVAKPPPRTSLIKGVNYSTIYRKMYN